MSTPLGPGSSARHEGEKGFLAGSISHIMHRYRSYRLPRDSKIKSASPPVKRGAFLPSSTPPSLASQGLTSRGLDLSTHCLHRGLPRVPCSVQLLHGVACTRPCPLLRYRTEGTCTCWGPDAAKPSRTNFPLWRPPNPARPVQSVQWCQATRHAHGSPWKELLQRKRESEKCMQAVHQSPGTGLGWICQPRFPPAGAARKGRGWRKSPGGGETKRGRQRRGTL